VNALGFAFHEFALARPWCAWGALLLLAALALLALWKRPGRVEVPSLGLWDQALQGSLPNRALPLLRALRALLGAAALSLAGLLAAGPIEGARGPLEWLVILDASPSMETREADGRTRMELAREAARRFVEALPERDTVELLVAARPPRLACAPGSPRASVVEALLAVTPEAPGADLEGALEIAAQSSRAIALFGDGAGERGAVEMPPQARIFGVGEARANRALVVFELEAAWPAPARIAYSLEASGGAPLPSELELVDPRGRVTRLAHDPTGTSGAAELPHWGGGIWTLRLPSDDALALDDAVRFRLDGLEPRGLALRPAPGRSVHPSLGVAFEIAAQSFEVPLRWLAAEEAPRADEVLVQDGGTLAPGDLPAAGALLFGAVLEGTLVADDAAAPARSAAVIAIDGARRALQGLALDRLRVRRAPLHPAPEIDCASWIAAGDRPLLYELRAGGARVLGTTFDLRESNLPAEPSFAVLAHRLVLELAAPTRAHPPLLEVGARAAPWMRSATDAIAGGTLREPWPATPLGLPAVLPREGSLALGGTEIPLELLDAESSRIAPGWSPGWSGSEPERPREERPLGAEVALLLVLVLLARAALDLLALT
jgi:hypothetical protein